MMVIYLIQDKSAIDFNMPVNTPIHAAREGMVVGVKTI
jgi:murein DD-endopeptidase MepM/ murein hydrolase activator NlpD